MNEPAHLMDDHRAAPTLAPLIAAVQATLAQPDFALAMASAHQVFQHSVQPGLALADLPAIFAEHLLTVACFSSLPLAAELWAEEQNIVTLFGPGQQIFAKIPENQALLADYRQWADLLGLSMPADRYSAIDQHFFPTRRTGAWPAGTIPLPLALADQLRPGCWAAPETSVLLPHAGDGQLAKAVAAELRQTAAGSALTGPRLYWNETAILAYWATCLQLAETEPAGQPVSHACLTEPLLTDDMRPNTVLQGSLFALRSTNSQRLQVQNAKKFTLIIDNLSAMVSRPTVWADEPAFRSLDRRAKGLNLRHELTGQLPTKNLARYWQWLIDRLPSGGLAVLLVDVHWLTSPAHQAARTHLERHFPQLWVVDLAQLPAPGLALLALARK